MICFLSGVQEVRISRTEPTDVVVILENIAAVVTIFKITFRDLQENLSSAKVVNLNVMYDQEN